MNTSEKCLKNVDHRPLLLRRLRERRSARQRERWQQQRNYALAWRVEYIFAGCGLSQSDYSIGGGRVVHIPQVVSVDVGPPERVDVRMLPGQTPDNFAAHAAAIAYNLGMAEVRVIPLSPSLIRLEMLPKSV